MRLARSIARYYLPGSHPIGYSYILRMSSNARFHAFKNVWRRVRRSPRRTVYRTTQDRRCHRYHPRLRHGPSQSCPVPPLKVVKTSVKFASGRVTTYLAATYSRTNDLWRAAASANATSSRRAPAMTCTVKTARNMGTYLPIALTLWTFSRNPYISKPKPLFSLCFLQLAITPLRYHSFHIIQPHSLSFNNFYSLSQGSLVYTLVYARNMHQSYTLGNPDHFTWNPNSLRLDGSRGIVDLPVWEHCVRSVAPMTRDDIIPSFNIVYTSEFPG